MPLPLWKILLFSIVSVALGLGLLEGAARLIVAPPDVRIHEEHEELISVLGLPALNGTMVFDPFLFWRLRDELHDFPVRGRIERIEIDFRVSTRRGLRHTTGGASDGTRTLLALGDSCTFGLGVDDGETWPSELQRLLGGDEGTRVINAGVPGYTAYQGRRLLEMRGGELEPDVIVATFGFNDIDVWGSQSDLETARALNIREWERPFRMSRLYVGLRELIGRMRGGAAEEGPGAEAAPASGEGRSRLSADEFRGELQRLAEESERLGAALVLMVWPYGEQIWNRFPPLANYQDIVLEVCAEREVPCINLIEVFLAAEGPLFLDHVHANAAGNAVAARAVRDVVVPLLSKRRAPN